MTYEECLKRLASDDERIVVMTAENRAAIRSLPSLLGSRFIDVGIAECTMIGAAAGMALRGRIPVVHALASFLTLRAFEFIRTDVGIGNLPVKMVGGVPGVLSEANGPTHQAIEDVSLMRGIPHVKVFAPADADDLIEGLPAVVADPSPFYIRFNTVPSIVRHAPFVIGRAETFGAGRDVALVTYGCLFGEAMGAAGILEKAGIAARVINLRTVKPLDAECLLDAAGCCRMIVTIEDHFRIGGLYSALAELLLEDGRAADVLPIAFDDRWFTPAMLPDVLDRERLTGAHIAERIAHALDRPASRRSIIRGIPIATAAAEPS